MQHASKRAGYGVGNRAKTKTQKVQPISYANLVQRRRRSETPTLSRCLTDALPVCVFRCTPRCQTKCFQDVGAPQMREVRVAGRDPRLQVHPPAQQRFVGVTSPHSLASRSGCPDAPLTISYARALDLTTGYRHRAHRGASASVYGSKLCRS